MSKPPLLHSADVARLPELRDAVLLQKVGGCATMKEAQEWCAEQSMVERISEMRNNTIVETEFNYVPYTPELLAVVTTWGRSALEKLGDSVDIRWGSPDTNYQIIKNIHQKENVVARLIEGTCEHELGLDKTQSKKIGILLAYEDEIEGPLHASWDEVNLRKFVALAKDKYLDKCIQNQKRGCLTPYSFFANGSEWANWLSLGPSTVNVDRQSIMEETEHTTYPWVKNALIMGIYWTPAFIRCKLGHTAFSKDLNGIYDTMGASSDDNHEFSFKNKSDKGLLGLHLVGAELASNITYSAAELKRTAEKAKTSYLDDVLEGKSAKDIEKLSSKDMMSITKSFMEVNSLSRVEVDFEELLGNAIMDSQFVKSWTKLQRRHDLDVL
jgi:hypothetical protein